MRNVVDFIHDNNTKYYTKCCFSCSMFTVKDTSVIYSSVQDCLFKKYILGNGKGYVRICGGHVTLHRLIT